MSWEESTVDEDGGRGGGPATAAAASAAATSSAEGGQTGECGEPQVARARSPGKPGSGRSSNHHHHHQDLHHHHHQQQQQQQEQQQQPSRVSPSGTSRRNRRKQSEPRRVSSSSITETRLADVVALVKQEPRDPSDRDPSDLVQGRRPTTLAAVPGGRTTVDAQYPFPASRHGYDRSSCAGDDGEEEEEEDEDEDVGDLIQTAMLTLRGHRAGRSGDDSTGSTASSTEDGLDLGRAAAAFSTALHRSGAAARMASVSEPGAGDSREASDDDMDMDDAKSELDQDERGTGSQGTGEGSPDLLLPGGLGEHRGDSSSSPDPSPAAPRRPSSPSNPTTSSNSKRASRSYKNLSRSRRIVANARERNRVHTISAAFEGLRRAVPSYSHNQKLSKLAILRIACSYILALASLADMDYSPGGHQRLSFGDCVDMCTRTLQSEGRSKRRKVQTD